MLAIDRHAWTNRWSDRHPLEKLVPAGGMLLVALILPPWPTAPLMIAVMLALTVVGARVPLKAALGTLAVPLGFLLTGVPVLALAVDVSDGLHIGLGAGWAAAGGGGYVAVAGGDVVSGLPDPDHAGRGACADAGQARRAEAGAGAYPADLPADFRLPGAGGSSGGRLRSPALAMTGRVVASGRSAGWPAACSSARLTGGGGLRRGLAARGFTGDLPQLGSDRAASGGWLLAGALLPVAVAAVSSLHGLLQSAA